MPSMLMRQGFLLRFSFLSLEGRPSLLVLTVTENLD